MVLCCYGLLSPVITLLSKQCYVLQAWVQAYKDDSLNAFAQLVKFIGKVSFNCIESLCYPVKYTTAFISVDI